jgi:tRNA pseudouridine32 synthase/23S rRNA pseudouridine746 synthase
MPSPFAVPPAAIARRAAEELVAELRGGPWADLLARDGKMFGVLVVRAPGGSVSVLRAFSGMLGGAWEVDGFAPPVFDRAARDAFWVSGEEELRALEARIAALDADPAHAELAALRAGFDAELSALRDVHAARKRERHAARAAGGDLHALAQQSRADTAERRRLEQAHAAVLAPVAARVADLVAERDRLAELRAERSRHFLVRIHDTYTFPSFAGGARSLRSLFAPAEPPGGAGDCAGPKLLVEAHRRGLVPVALAEVWVGAPPPTGDRRDGVFYPCCRGKCGPILPYILDGLDVEPAPAFATSTAAPLPVVFEDAWMLVVEKPAGMLSVPGRHETHRDSAIVRLRREHPDATLVHRLDLDTSGLLLVAKDPETHATMQRAFARREVEKRYVAVVDGVVAGESGTIDLPLRVDLDDRPRQIHDPVHGKDAVTDWRVLSRGSQTRVALFPRTGRTHQLRVHCAHPLGLAAPIVGDRLYGAPADRLHLHAESLRFTHPVTGATIELTSAAPF